jgi:hypothetical protein
MRHFAIGPVNNIKLYEELVGSNIYRASDHRQTIKKKTVSCFSVKPHEHDANWILQQPNVMTVVARFRGCLLSTSVLGE